VVIGTRPGAEEVEAGPEPRDLAGPAQP